MNDRCNRCKKRILSHSVVLTCNLCLYAYHVACITIDKEDHEYVCRADRQWYCSPCNQEIFPCNFVDDDDDFAELLYNIFADIPLAFHEIETMIFNPFSTNTKSFIPLHDVDPDIQFFNDVAHPCKSVSDYYLEDQFNDKFSNQSNTNTNLLMMHLNIRSLPAHILEMESYLSLLCCQFHFIGISESWLTENNNSLYCLEDYNHVSIHRSSKAGGGLSLFIK